MALDKIAYLPFAYSVDLVSSSSYKNTYIPVPLNNNVVLVIQINNDKNGNNYLQFIDLICFIQFYTFITFII